MARIHPILCGTLIALCGCAATPSPKPVEQPPAQELHQTPDDPNPNALPPGVLEWINAVCATEDEAELARLLEQGEANGWNADCPPNKPEPPVSGIQGGG